MKDQIEVLKDFEYGDVSDPKRMRAGNIQAVPDDVSPMQLARWVRAGFVRMVA